MSRNALRRVGARSVDRFAMPISPQLDLFGVSNSMLQALTRRYAPGVLAQALFEAELAGTNARDPMPVANQLQLRRRRPARRRCRRTACVKMAAGRQVDRTRDLALEDEFRALNLGVG